MIISNVPKWLVFNIKKVYPGIFSLENLSHSSINLLKEEPHKILIFSTNRISDFTSLGNMEDIVETTAKLGFLEKIIFLSSYGVYKPKNTPFSEENKIEPRNINGVFSADIESFLFYLSLRYNLKVITFRMFNLYGPFQTSPYIIPSILEQLIGNKKLYIGDKSKIRDFLYIDDFISVLRKVIEIEIDINDFSVYNIGSGEGKSIEDVLKIAEQVIEKESRLIFDATKIRYEYDYDCAIADISKVKRELGWLPKVDLKTGISLMYQWIIGKSGVR
jgi:UDP-glucose 4-epimerase